MSLRSDSQCLQFLGRGTSTVGWMWLLIVLVAEVFHRGEHDWDALRWSLVLGVLVIAAGWIIRGFAEWMER